MYPPRPHVTKNRYETVIGPTTAGTESFTEIALGIEAPTNRSLHVPAGATVRSIVVAIKGTEPIVGKHQCLMIYKPAAENVATAIAAYWDTTDPLTEEGVKLRRLAMSKVTTVQTPSSNAIPANFLCKWKGAKHFYDGDSIDIFILDLNTAATYNVQVWLTFTQ